PGAEALRRLGHDVVTLAEAGLADAGLPDDAVSDAAVADGRAVLTLNRRDFLRLHRLRPDHAGIVICTFDPDFDAQASRIDSALRAHPDPAGLLIRVNLP
ncbi:MAG TPA: DUF5615 family PIN-like protein, partial [Planctomycetaceae bacterium]